MSVQVLNAHSKDPNNTFTFNFFLSYFLSGSLSFFLSFFLSFLSLSVTPLTQLRQSPGLKAKQKVGGESTASVDSGRRSGRRVAEVLSTHTTTLTQDVIANSY